MLSLSSPAKAIYPLWNEFPDLSVVPHLSLTIPSVSYLAARQSGGGEVKWISGSSPLEHSLLVPEAGSHQWSLHA